MLYVYTMEGHNLNIHMYSLREVLDLFHLSTTITEEDLKRAKKQVLMTHPDKSKLSADYFLFFKKAFEVVVRLYEQQQKEHQEVKHKDYEADSLYQTDKSITKQVSKNLQDMSKSQFGKQFNTLFEENMVKKVDDSKNDWFKSDEPTYEVQKNVNQNSMGEALQSVRTNQNAMTRYNGIQVLHSKTAADSLYDDEDGDVYAECDPFSKLKFDDLRKVHKDQTIFSVSEKDYDNVPKYNSMDHYVRARDSQPMDPLEKQQAEQLLAKQSNQYRERILQKEYESLLETKKYEEKNKTVLSKFLRIMN